jgi:3-oxoacyl-[acyl-carrier protein] reductase
MSRSIVSTGASKGIGRAAEIAAAIAFLAGERAAFITGQTLFMDGGASLGRL